MQATKSTLAVARTALEAAKRALPDYACPKSPKKFTQPQLLACLVVKEFQMVQRRSEAVDKPRAAIESLDDGQTEQNQPSSTPKQIPFQAQFP